MRGARKRTSERRTAVDRKKPYGRIIAGIIVIAIGVLFLLDNLGVIRVGQAFQWIPSLFILWGLWLLVKNRFRNVFGPLLMIVIALFVQLMLLDVGIGRYWPVIVIAVGLALVAGAFRSRGRRRRRERRREDDSETPHTEVAYSSQSDDPDSINTVSVMGTSRESRASDDFRGGEATAVMGQVHLDLRGSSVADKPATLELNAVMGEIKLRVPSEWDVRIDNVTLMGGTSSELPRREAQEGSPDLIITGNVLMGSLKIED